MTGIEIAISRRFLFVIFRQSEMDSQGPGLPNPVFELMHANESFYTFMVASLGLGAIATLVLGFSGVELLMGQGWGRILAIGYSVYAILSAVVGVIVNWIFVFGPMMEMANDAGLEQQGAIIGGMIGGSIGGCCGTIYPIILLCLLLPEKIKQALD